MSPETAIDAVISLVVAVYAVVVLVVLARL